MTKTEKEQTLADLALRGTLKSYRKRSIPIQFREPLLAARRFVLDNSASEFLSDLSHANFANTATPNMKRGSVAMEASRCLARLPHRTTWIEYDARAERRRTLAAYADVVRGFGISHDGRRAEHSARLDDPSKVCPRVGWLMRQHQSIETAFRATIFLDVGDYAVVVPHDCAWTTNGDAVPWTGESIPMDLVPIKVASHPDRDHAVGALLTGLIGYSGHGSVDILLNGALNGNRSLGGVHLQKMMIENAGEMRRILTLLSAINDVPIGVKRVVPSHGFVAQGKYRKFLEHSVISVLLPKGRDPRAAARHVIAVARRRAHQVRGHWRRDWRHEGQRLWIKEHQRGDASIGFVIHDYKVEHEGSPS